MAGSAMRASTYARSAFLTRARANAQGPAVMGEFGDIASRQCLSEACRDKTHHHKGDALPHAVAQAQLDALLKQYSDAARRTKRSSRRAARASSDTGRSWIAIIAKYRCRACA